MGIVTTSGESVLTTSGLHWREELRRAVRDPRELLRRLELPEAFQAGALEAAQSFPLMVPLPYVAKMKTGDANDPLLRQVLPVADELKHDDRYSFDPLHEESATLTPGLLQKYAGRALIVTTGACAVHCRYCFRRHFPYAEGPPVKARLEAALQRIGDDDSIEEVLLSGGDPLMLDDDILSELADRIQAIPHVRRLRLHTRLPVVIPARIDRRFIEWFDALTLNKIVVLHANHANELDDELADAVTRLRSAGAMVLNQAVLLAGINDSLGAQEDLCRGLIQQNVLPYYLHQMDRVAGAAHFDLDERLGVSIIAGLRERLPGYAVPRFVREAPGEHHKRVLA